MTSADTSRRLPNDDFTGRPVTKEIPRFATSEMFGRYRIEEKVGGGGMGSVYRAYDTTLERFVALKIPHFCASSAPELIERFQREAKAMATLNHPNLCQVFDVGNLDGIHYFTMAFVEGETLAKAMGVRTFSIVRVVDIVRTIALAMHEAHLAGVVHRDIKPANIMMDQRDNPIIIDFGLAFESVVLESNQSDPFIGTPMYMSPEQANGDLDAIGPLSDIFSLGVVLYRMLTNRLPFEGSGLWLLTQIQAQTPLSPRLISPQIPIELEAICLRCLSKSPHDRFASMAELATALANLPSMNQHLDRLLVQKQSRTTLAPNRKYDLFVSYAPLDDHTSPVEAKGWVSKLIEDLAWRLCQLHGRTDEISFAVSHDPIHEGLVSEAPRFSDSALILLIDSPGFRNIVWNRTEAERLRTECSRRREDTILVERDRPLGSLLGPGPDGLVSFRFWHDIDEQGQSLLDGEGGKTFQQRYYSAIDDLARHVYSRLLSCRLAATDLKSFVPGKRFNYKTKRSVVFLAETTEDIESKRERVRRYLDQSGIDVVPRTSLPRTTKEYCEAVREQLQASDLFVQLLGSHSGRLPPDGNESYATLQLRMAQQVGCTVMQWRFPNIALSNVADLQQRELLLGQEVQRVALAEFNRSIVEHLRQKQLPDSSNFACDCPLIFVNIEPTDQALADSLCPILSERGMALALPLPMGQPRDVLMDLEANLIDCDALLIAYGMSPVQWAREQLRIYRRIIHKRNKPLRALAVLEGPPSGKVPLGMILPNMLTIDCRDGIEPRKLEQFLNEIELAGQRK